MSHLSTGMREAASHNPKHNGASQRIRCALRDAGRRMSIDAICLATGLKREQVRSAITQMMGAGGSGGIVASRDSRSRVCCYELYRVPLPKPAPVRGDEFRIAGRITINQYRWGSTRLG